MPKIDIYSKKYIFAEGIIKGAKSKNKEEKSPSAKIDINGPKINSSDIKISENSPEINLGGEIDKKNKIELKSPNTNIDLNVKNSNKEKDFHLSGIIPGINTSSNLNVNKDINLNGPNIISNNIKIEGKTNKLDINGPKINLPSGGGDLNINKNINIDGNYNNFKIDIPDINIKKPEIGIKYPEFDINKSKIDINKNAPEIDLKNPNLKTGINKNEDLMKIGDSNKFDVKFSNIYIKGPKIDETDLNMNLPKKHGKGLDLNLKGPKIEGKGLDVQLNGPKIEGKGLYVNLNESKKERKINELKDVDFFRISGIIEGTKEKKDIEISKNKALKENIPGISVNSPNLNINGSLPDTKISGPKINTNDIGGNINFKGFNAESEGIIPGINIKNKNNLNIPSTNINLSGPEINNNIKGKAVDLNINGSKIEGTNTNLNLDGKLDGDIKIINPNLNTNITGGKIETSKIEINGPQSKSSSYFIISGIIPSKDEQNAGKKIIIDAPNINIDRDNFNYSNKKNFHRSLNNQLNLENQFGNLKGPKILKNQIDDIKGLRKLENISRNNNINIQMQKVEIKSNENINIGDQNKIEIGGGKIYGDFNGEIGGGINLAKNIPTKLEFKNDNEDNKFGVNLNINGDIKNENTDLNDFGMNFNNEQKVGTKVSLNSSIGASKRKGKLPTVGIKNSNFEPSKIDVAGNFNVENIDIENLNSANVGINGQKIGERIEE